MAGFGRLEDGLRQASDWYRWGPYVSERQWGTVREGNHGEDAKEYWRYLDALPGHAWNRWRYHYPQGAFPYQDLIDTNRGRDRNQPEYELLDTGAFDGDRYRITEVTHYLVLGWLRFRPAGDGGGRAGRGAHRPPVRRKS